MNFINKMCATKHLSILIGTQRTGTGLLGSIFRQHPQLIFPGEVFHPENLGIQDSYFKFIAELVELNPYRSMPWQTSQNFQDYAKTLQKRYPGKLITLDIKYRSLHHLNGGYGGWFGLNEMPWIIHYAMENQLPIIHLTRKNLASIFVSARLADKNQIWHTNKKNDIKISSVVINVKKLLNFIERTANEVKLITSWTKNYPNLVNIEYENMIDDRGLFNINIANKLSLVLGVDPFEKKKPLIVKQAKKCLSESIINYDEVKESFNGTKYEWMMLK